MNTERKYKAIVIGTSAGGLFALSSLFKKLPASYPIPIIVVQHRSKDQRELLEEVLQNKSRLAVKQADEKEKIEPGAIYIAPPDYHLLVERDETFSLSADEAVRFSRPSINVLFETAALVYKETLVAIILTGASDDGTAGITAVKKYGGLTIAQEPTEAAFSIMPRSAIDTGDIDHTLSLSGTGDLLLKIAGL